MKSKDIQKISKEEAEKKIKELKIELIKARVGASKAGSSKIKETKRMIARLIMINKPKQGELKNK